MAPACRSELHKSHDGKYTTETIKKDRHRLSCIFHSAGKCYRTFLFSVVVAFVQLFRYLAQTKSRLIIADEMKWKKPFNDIQWKNSIKTALLNDVDEIVVEKNTKIVVQIILMHKIGFIRSLTTEC